MGVGVGGWKKLELRVGVGGWKKLELRVGVGVGRSWSYELELEMRVGVGGRVGERKLELRVGVGERNSLGDKPLPILRVKISH